MHKHQKFLTPPEGVDKMSVEEVERVLLYSLEASVSVEERKRQEVIKTREEYPH